MCEVVVDKSPHGPNKKKRTESLSIPSVREESPVVMIVSPGESLPRRGEGGLVPTVFRWRHGGEEVEVAGSFNRWADRLPLHHSRDDFTCIQNLPPGTYHYKYIVDGEWKVDPSMPVELDESGMANNVLEVLRPKKEEKLAAQPVNTSSSPPGSYAQEIPSCFPSTETPPALPPHLQYALLNTDPQEKDPSLLPLPHHVMLNHLYSLTRSEGKVMILGVTQRHSKSSDPDTQKYVTTVFYKPMQTLRVSQ